ncbi:MAG: S8 family serine peptidase [Actinomycetota bacterium]|nr:S8 family serine peptidase [Actinomycetota bacterium]
MTDPIGRRRSRTSSIRGETARSRTSPTRDLSRSILILAIAFAWLGAFGHLTALAAPPGGGPPGSGASTQSVLVRESHDSNSHGPNASPVWTRVSVPHGESLDDAYKRLSISPGVAEVALEFEYREAAAPNDPSYASQWHLRTIDVEGAWEYGKGSGAVVAVLDSGVSTGGSDLSCRTFVAPYNAFTGETSLASVLDDTGHGTHVTGTIAQCTDNGIGAAGVAPGVSIMPIRVLDGGSGSSLELANGIHWAVDHGVDVINLSLGRSCSASWPTCSDVAVDSAIEYADSNGVLVVVAAGNDGTGVVSSPANHPNSLAVGATTSVDTLATYSNHGTALDLVAPGGNSGDLDGDARPDGIFQESFTTAGWGIVQRIGTSSASPHVAGVAALLLSIDPDLTVHEIKEILASTSVDLGPGGWDSMYGAGRVAAAAAAAVAAGDAPPPTTTTTTTTTPPPAISDGYALGGPAAVSASVLSDVSGIIGATPPRLDGPDRYETAAAISREFNPAGAYRVYLVTGQDFPDTLSIGPVAAIDNAPILLVTRTGIPQATTEELERLAPSEIVIVGGTAVVETSVEDRVQSLTVGTVHRINGADRYATAVAVSQSAFAPGVNVVVLVTGEKYPDGLTAGPVAAKLGGPVLLTRSDSLPTVTRDEILRLSPDTVIIAGGTDAVAATVETAVEHLGLSVLRVAGPDRYATAASLSSTYFDSTTRPVFLATGEAFPDALSGSAAAGRVNGPLLLTRTAALPPSTREELERLFP